MPAVEQFDWQDLLNLAISDSMMESDAAMTQINTAARRIMWNNSMYTEDEAIQAASAQFMRLNGFDVTYNRTTGWKTYPRYNTTKTVTPQQVFTGVVNSNNQVTRRGSLRTLYGSIKEFDGTNHFMQMTRFPISGGLGAKASYILGSVNGAIGAVATGTWLGKIISPLLYQANPNFWESIGVSQGAFQPESWSAITNGSDSPFAGLFNFILGIDPNTGAARTYIDQNALAYMAFALAQNGAFNGGTVNIPSGFSDYTGTSPLPIVTTASWTYDSGRYSVQYSMYNGCICGYQIISNRIYIQQVYCSDTSGRIEPIFGGTITDNSTGTVSVISGAYAVLNDSYTYDGRTVYYASRSYDTRYDANSLIISTTAFGEMTNPIPNRQQQIIAWSLVYGEHNSLIDGISDQQGATLPDISDWTDIPSTLASLQSQYPDTFADGMQWAVDDPASNSIGDTITYVPVPFPQTNSMTDTQPITGTQTQTTLNVNDLPYTLQQTIASIVQQTEPSDTPEIPPSNPSDIGEGDTPIPVPSSGSATALWSVYHPTQGQINSFGAWLWGAPFLTNIGKLFQNPIDGVISLQKIFVPPIDSGTRNIVVGTLDSGVSSATVTEQYVYVDCGSVQCREDFASVFDYPPHTSVSLYLPFIGIVPLDTNDVMRSTINVVYGADVFTGACIAMVKVTRDGHSVNMYQFAGNCAVNYPLSNTQHAQTLTGLAAIAGAIGTVATAGAITPVAVAAGVAGVANMAKTNIGRSGGFSGNAGAMGIKKPYLIIQRPQTKVARNHRIMDGHPTNASIRLGNCSGHVVCSTAHIYGTNATEREIEMIEDYLSNGVEV